MSKDDRNRLYEAAIANGWSESDVLVAYFEATWGIDEPLLNLAQTTPESEDAC